MPEGFRNPVAAGRQLIADALQSLGFVSGAAGWRVSRDGAAEFNNLVARGDIIFGGGSSMTDTLKKLMASGTFGTFDTPGQTTTTTYAPITGFAGTTGYAVMSVIKSRVQQYAPDLADTAMIDVVLQVASDVKSSATSGSGGHYLHQVGSTDNGGTVYGSYGEVANRFDNGHVNAVSTHSFGLTWAQVKAWSLDSNTSPFQVSCKHTGATAYIVDQIFFTVTWRVRLT